MGSFARIQLRNRSKKAGCIVASRLFKTKRGFIMAQKKAFPVAFVSRKAAKREEMNFFDLPEASQQAIIRYGCQRFINDKLGGAELGQEEAAEKFESILDQLREGWVDRRGNGGGAGPVDPIEKKMHELAREQIKGALRQKGIKIKQVPKEKMAELVSGLVQKNEESLRKQAERLVAIENESLNLGGLDLDLDMSGSDESEETEEETGDE